MSFHFTTRERSIVWFGGLRLGSQMHQLRCQRGYLGDAAALPGADTWMSSEKEVGNA